MITLSVDTCLGMCSAAIFDKEECISYNAQDMPHKQAEALLPMIDKMLDQTGLQYSDFDNLSATVGPGSFTGIRIGIAAIQGINFSLNKRTIGVSTLEALSIASKKKTVIATLNAGRGEVYCQKFCDSKAESNIALLSVEEAKRFVQGHDVIGFLGEKELPNAKIAGIAAIRKIDDARKVNFPLEPLYIRQPDAITQKTLKGVNA